MHRTLTILLLIASLASACIAAPPVPTGPRLREIVAANYPNGNVLVGATTGEWAFGTDQGVLMDREFSYVTPENDFKQSTIHPYPGKWSWSKPDAWVSHILANRQILRVHGPISPQASSWALDDARTAAELEQNMREFFTALCQRYNGRPGFKYLDVINEVVINGWWHTDKPGTGWECPWFKIGQENNRLRTPLYIIYAFEIAAEHAKDFRLVLNHHESPARQASWNLLKDLVYELMDRGLPIHGVGWQAHVNAGWDTTANLAALSALIDWTHTMGLDFHVTEQGVHIPDQTPASLDLQARTYRRIVEVLLQHRRGGLVAWNTWHISDAHGWQTEEFPSLFDTAYAPKPAYYALQSLLSEHSDLLCDFNLDQQVNPLDLAYLASRWLHEDPIFEPADLNASGRVDAPDLALFHQQYNNVPPSAPDND